MLSKYITQFLDYCQTANFAVKSIETLSFRLIEFDRFLLSQKIRSLQKIRYVHVSAFITDHHSPSLHVIKARVWALRHFFHFLKLRNLIDTSPVRNIPYPKIRKKVPRYLTSDQFNQLLEFFAKRCRSTEGLQNLVIIMLFGFLGLRSSTLLRLNVEHVDTKNRCLRLFDKGRIVRSLCLPLILCRLLKAYIQSLSSKQGPLFLSQRQKRLRSESLQMIFNLAMEKLHLNFRLHSHIFRHTAATQLNKVAGPDIVQYILGHARWENTLHYTHLNPDIYAAYMKRHPYHLFKE